MIATLLLLVALLLPSVAEAQIWPHEPSGATVLTDWPFTSVTGSGWTGTGSIVSDSTAPLSPSNVLEFRLNVGTTNGGGEVFYYFPNQNLNEVYVGFWWKPSNPFEGWDHFLNKVGFLGINPNYGHFVWYMTGQQRGGPYVFHPQLQFVGIDNCHLGNGYGDCPGTYMLFGNRAGGGVTLGAWHRIEIYAKASTTTTSQDGIVRWWINGTLTGDYSTVNMPGPLPVWWFTPTWDGSAPPTHTQPFYHRFDHTHISTGGTPGGGVDTTPPNPVTGITVE